jgi:hypothetical protein
MFGRMKLLFRMNPSLTLVNPSPAKSRKQLGHNEVKGNVQKLLKITYECSKVGESYLSTKVIVSKLSDPRPHYNNEHLAYNLIGLLRNENTFTVAKC